MSRPINGYKSGQITPSQQVLPQTNLIPPPLGDLPETLCGEWDSVGAIAHADHETGFSGQISADWTECPFPED